MLFFITKGEKAEIALGLTFSFIGSVMFCAGIINVLSVAAYFIWAGGLLLCIKGFWNRGALKRIFTVGTVFFILGAGILFQLLHNAKFIDYDNFSHWAIVLKMIITKNRFPVKGDLNIFFQSYPLGSAAFIFYFTKITTITSEWFQAYVQAVLILGMLVSLFSVAKNVVHYISVALVVVAMMIANTPLIDLLVDTLLPSVAISAFVYCVQMHSFRGRYKCLLLILYLSFLISIKNSGIFFIGALVWYLLYSKKIDKKNTIKLLLPVVILFLLWRVRVLVVFPRGFLSKHSMSLIGFAAVMIHKSFGGVLKTIGAFLASLVSVHNRVIFLIVFCVLLGIWKYIHEEKQKLILMRSALFYCITVYLAYLIGMLGMYIFSMPDGEAKALSGFYRYHETCLIFISGILLTEYMHISSDLNIRSAIADVFLTMSILLCLNPNIENAKQKSYEGSDRQIYDSLIDENIIEPGKKYLVIEEGQDYGYLDFLTRYLLDAESVEEKKVAEIVPEDIETNDYIIVIHMTEEIREYMQNEYSDVSSVIRLRN